MIRVRALPEEVNVTLASSQTVMRLASGDLLDQATYASSLVAMIIREARALGASHLELEVEGAGEIHDHVAEANHLICSREVLKMWRELPAGRPGNIATRPFVVGGDEAAWLAVNNRAFVWHPDQSDRDLDNIRSLEAEPWFDAEGFLVHEDGGRIAGFCWTKIHHDEHPRLGEIYVIAVDPDFHGRGLGRELVLAGLDWLTHQDLRHAILYVEGSNTVARNLYEDLGFIVTDAHRWWTIEL